MAHKILSFVIHDQQTRGRGYWKLNSSVLNDNAYVAMVRQTIDNVDRLNIEDKQHSSVVGYFSVERSLQDGGIYQTKAHDREFRP